MIDSGMVLYDVVTYKTRTRDFDVDIKMVLSSVVGGSSNPGHVIAEVRR